MVGWHRQLNGHAFQQTPGDNERQGSSVCCNPGGHKESDLATKQQQRRVLQPLPKVTNDFHIMLAGDVT